MRYLTWLLVGLSFYVAPYANATEFTMVNLPTNDIVYDHVTDTIYASVPSTAGAVRGNTITPINPHTGALGTSVFVTSEPSILALADDGSRVYVASQSTNLVTPFALSTMTPGTAFPIGSGDRRVKDMEVAPGNPGALAVSKSVGGSSRGISVFLNGTLLPESLNDVAINDVIEFGDTAETLYGHANSFSELDFNKFRIDLSPTGGIINEGFHVKHLLSGSGSDMEYQNGRMYFTNGQVLETATPGPVGSFSASGPVQPDMATGRTFFVSGNNLKSFNQMTFVPLGTVPVPGMTGSAKNLISLGANSLAFATTSGKVYIARGNLVTAATGDFDEDNDVDGSDFLAWQRGLGVATAASRGQGDGNGDGDVDGNDLTTWRQQFGAVTGASPTLVAIPEPSSSAVALVAAACMAMRSRGARRALRLR